MIETLQKPKKERLKWKRKSCSAVAPVAKFDEEGDLIFTWRWYDVYRRRLNMYKDTPYAQVPVREYAPRQEKTRVIYERVVGTSKQEWMDEEETRYNRIRTECARIAINNKKKLTHPI